MQYLGDANRKRIHYATQPAALTAMLQRNWMVMVLADHYQAKIHTSVLKNIVAYEPLFVYGCCSNFPDMEDAVADLLCEAFPGFDDDTVMPMSFGGSDLADAVHFCVYDAFHETREIEDIVIVDLRSAPDVNTVTQAVKKAG